jgi:hypothetical protein
MHVIVTKTGNGEAYATTFEGQFFPVSLLEAEIDMPGTYLFHVEIKNQMLEFVSGQTEKVKTLSLPPIQKVS